MRTDDPAGGKLVGGSIDLRLGHREGSGHWYNGLLDEIAVFSVALNEKQVKEASEELSVLMTVQAQGKLTTSWGKIKSSN